MKSVIKNILFVAFCISIFLPCHNLPGENDFKNKQVLVVFSGIEASGEKTIKDIMQNILTTYRINTIFERLQNKADETRETKNKNINDLIKKYNPDLLVAVGKGFSKDNIPQELAIPLIFCAFPWYMDMNQANLKNVTGMTEVDFVDKAVDYLSKFTKKDRISCIMPESEISRKNGRLYNEIFFSAKMNIMYVKDFNAFKEAYLKLQNNSDMLIINNCAELTDWNSAEAEKYLRENVKIPSASNNDYMASMVLFSINKQFDEFGLYAADTTLKLLIDGINASELPVLANSRINITVNMIIAQKLGLVIPYSLLKTAHKIR